MHLTTLEEAAIIPGKHSGTRIFIKPLTLANGHGHYTTVTPERTPVSVGNGRYVLLLKRLRNGRFTSETAVRRFQVRRFRNETANWIQKWFKNSA